MTNTEQLEAEFDRQVANMVSKGYLTHLKLTEAEFKAQIMPLKAKAASLEIPCVPAGVYLPFVLVVPHTLVPSEAAMEVVNREGKNGIIALTPRVPTDFRPTELVKIPENVYLIVNIDRGAKTINVAPDDALKMLVRLGRSPLTIDEGLAIITHYPEYLEKNNCFSLLASRAGDKRVPAIWLSENQPKLGWCWAGNPHTWLGSASCIQRIGMT